MGCKRFLEENKFEDLPFKKVKHFEYNNELASFADIDVPNNATVKPLISGKVVEGFYNIQWYDALETDAVAVVPHAGDKDAKTNGHCSSSSNEDETGSGEASLSSVSSDCLGFDYPREAFVSLDDAYSALDRSPRRPVPVGPNHQATIPVWRGRVNKISGFTGTYNHDSPSSGLVSVNTADDLEEKLMGTSVISMPDSNFNSLKSNKVGEGRTECNCLVCGSIRCVRQHVREARENLRKNLGNENFVSLGFSDMGEEVALKWSEEEEEVFHEVIYNNPATLGRKFWKQLAVTFPSRTKKEIVSYYFNVYMLRRRAAQNRSRFLDIDSDDDECPMSNTGFCGFGVSEEDNSAIESVDDQDVRDNYSEEDDDDVRDNYSEEDDDVDDNSDDGTNTNYVGSAGYDMGNITEEEGGVDQGPLECKGNSQIERWCDGISGIAKEDFSIQDDSCVSFECQTNMDESCGPMDASPTLQATGFKCDQSPNIHGKLDLSCDMMEHVYLLDQCDSKDWYPGYSTSPTTDTDFLPTSNLIEEFFGQGTPDKKTRND